jgi:hypothetical protein
MSRLTKEELWARFAQTGEIAAYLAYKRCEEREREE